MNREQRKLVKVKSNRFKGYDYAKPGEYFITICTMDRTCMFGEIVSDKMRLNFLGEIVREELFRSFVIRKELILDEWVIMPNHVHLIAVPSSEEGLRRAVGEAHRPGQVVFISERRSPVDRRPKGRPWRWIAQRRPSTTRPARSLLPFASQLL